MFVLYGKRIDRTLEWIFLACLILRRFLKHLYSRLTSKTVLKVDTH